MAFSLYFSKRLNHLLIFLNLKLRSEKCVSAGRPMPTASIRMAALGCHTKIAKKQPPPVAPTNSNEIIDDDDFLK
jgi:hypothetical protein